MKSLHKLINTEVRKALNEELGDFDTLDTALTDLPYDGEFLQFVTDKDEDTIYVEILKFSELDEKNTKVREMETAIKNVVTKFVDYKISEREVTADNITFEIVNANVNQNENKMSKTKMIVKRLKEDTNYRMFFDKVMDKFKIKSPADLKNLVKKKEFFDYVDDNYTSNDEK